MLPGENREEFNQLCGDLEVEWDPQSRTEQFYLEQMAVSQWKLTRMEVAGGNIFKDASRPEHADPLLRPAMEAECRLELTPERASCSVYQTSRPQPDHSPKSRCARCGGAGQTVSPAGRSCRGAVTTNQLARW